jgi:aconitase A
MPRPAAPSPGARRPPRCAVHPIWTACQPSHPLVPDIVGARVLVKLGDSITDHIPPAGAIPPNSEAGRYLASLGVPPGQLNADPLGSQGLDGP